MILSEHQQQYGGQSVMAAASLVEVRRDWALIGWILVLLNCLHISNSRGSLMSLSPISLCLWPQVVPAWVGTWAIKSDSWSSGFSSGSLFDICDNIPSHQESLKAHSRKLPIKIMINNCSNALLQTAVIMQHKPCNHLNNSSEGRVHYIRLGVLL